MSLPKTAVAAIILGVVLLLALESQGCNKGALPSPDTTTEAGSAPGAPAEAVPSIAPERSQELPLALRLLTVDEFAEEARQIPERDDSAATPMMNFMDGLETVDVLENASPFSVSWLPPEYEFLRGRLYRRDDIEWNSLAYIGPLSTILTLTEQPFGVSEMRSATEHTETIIVNGGVAYLIQGVLGLEYGGENAAWDTSRHLALYFRSGNRVFELTSTSGTSPSPDEMARIAESVT